MIPFLTSEFRSLDNVAYYSSVLLPTMATSQGVWGKAFKDFNIKIVYLVMIFIFELGSLIGASAPATQQPILTGFLFASYAVASAVGPITGGTLTDKVSWRWLLESPVLFSKPL